jgi:hypothetical protein
MTDARLPTNVTGADFFATAFSADRCPMKLTGGRRWTVAVIVDR